MNQYRTFFLGFLIITLVTPGLAQESNSQSIDYIRNLQRKAGGFAISAKEAGCSLRATSAAIRALHYFGGDIPDKAACSKFVLACLDNKTGGFADLPGGKPDLVSTAVGLMAVVALKIPHEPFLAQSLNYLDEHARSFEEIRLAAAAFEAVGKKPVGRKRWLDLILKMAKGNGTFGENEDNARDLGGAAVAILRLEGELPNKKAILQALNAGQRQSGGFGKPGEDADTETCYRVSRAFFMLHDKPQRQKALKQFIARCRNADGGYGSMPCQPSSVSATYHASIILHWFP